MTSSNKAALRAAKTALDNRRYEEAAKEARKVLEADPNHYHANVFLGLALERSQQYEEAERVYNHAASVKDDDALVWQGLVGLYEQQANKKIDEYAKASRKLGRIFVDADDLDRCQSVVDRYVGHAKQYGTKSQYREALEIMLPSSELYDFLEGRLPSPALTYPKVSELVEDDEKQRVNKLIGERKTRLGAKIGEVTLEAKREVFTNSPLEHLYQQVIQWTTDDDIRWLYEGKLLQRAYENLSVLSPDRKAKKRTEVQKLAEGMVIVKNPFHLAWKIVLEWKDVSELRELDPQTITTYMKLFPDDGLTKVLAGWLASSVSPFPDIDLPKIVVEDKDGELDQDSKPMTEEERLVLMTSGLEESARSLLSQRLMALYYLQLEEYSSALEASRKSKGLVLSEKKISGLTFQSNMDALDIIIATCLVHYQSPRHHNEARHVFEQIVERKPHSIPCLIGLGLILEEEENFQDAVGFFSKTLEQSPDIKIRAEAAWCKALAGDNKAGLSELKDCLSEAEESYPIDSNFKSQLLYRVGICLWNEDPSKSARKDRTRGYQYFLSSLQANLNYAPSYTMLGIYYIEYGKDKKRARKCFQKAFELSPSEVVAAERLARSFADNSEWDVVEAVAKRVIESGKTRPPPGSKKRGLSWPYSALGVCQINNVDFANSIVSFQSALRAAPEDVHAWIGLGESYHGSGRYISATKAFEQVQLIQGRHETRDEEAAWFAQYMLANVERELGRFDEAIDRFRDVLSLRPHEFGVTVALLQTYVEASWYHVERGLFGRAAQHASEALEIAHKLTATNSDAFNLWKAIGDACAIFTFVQAWSEEFKPTKVQEILQTAALEEQYCIMSEFDRIGLSKIAELSTCEDQCEAAMHAAVLAHKRAVYCSSNDKHAQAVAWYNLGWTEYRSHLLLNNEVETGKTKASPRLKTAVRCFKRAIELEAGNSEFWNSLGIVTTSLNPKVAQHAFVRSLYLNGNSARVWTNLGTFYLLQNDLDLALEALNRGQSTDPDYAPAWLGQGVLALLAGDLREANNVFTHAFEIADSTSLIGKRLFSSTLFDVLLSSPENTSDLADLIQPLFALLQLKSQAPGDVVHRHLACLYMERVDNNGITMDSLEDICVDIETEYEVSESETTLKRFAQAKSDLARACLASGNFVAAAENAETALDLSREGNADESREKCRLSSHLTAGLAYNYLEEPAKAIAMFRTALTESAGNCDAVCLLAQVLWAKGGENERNVAREQLLDSIEAHPEHANTIMLLAVIAILDNDVETIEAVLADLHGLRTRSDLPPQLKLQVGRILTAAARFESNGSQGGPNPDPSIQSEVTTSTMVMPNQPQGWAQLTRVHHSESYPPQMALLTALKAIPPKGSLDAADLADAYAASGLAADAQRGVALAPWRVNTWGALV